MSKIMANDPSFTAWGWVVFDTDKPKDVLDCGCIKTENSQKKRNLRAGDDRVRRISIINNQLLGIIDKHEVNYILAEAPTGSQSSSAAMMIGAVTGIIQTIADCRKTPIDWYTIHDIRKVLGIRVNSSKPDIFKAVSKKYKGTWYANKPKYVQEAIADAIAVYNCGSVLSKVNLWGN